MTTALQRSAVALMVHGASPGDPERDDSRATYKQAERSSNGSMRASAGSSRRTRSIQRTSARGFTLLEVLVAVSILGLGLTVILSSQVGLFSSSQRAENLTLATHLLRCRMGETEAELLKMGFTLTDTTTDEGPCCADESDSKFRCARKIERVQLPQPAGFGLPDGGVPEGGAPPSSFLPDGGQGILQSSIGPALNAPGMPGNPGGPPGALGALGALGSPGALGALGSMPGMQGPGSPLGGAGVMGAMSSSGGVQGLVSMLMGMVYPDLKRMLEASIRKVTITVKWKEGRLDRDLEIIQYVTNPMQGLDPTAMAQLQALSAALGTQGAAGAGATGTSTGAGTGTAPGLGGPSGFGTPGGFGTPNPFGGFGR